MEIREYIPGFTVFRRHRIPSTKIHWHTSDLPWIIPALMPLRDLSNPAAVNKAITECDRLGREKFLAQYGFRPCSEYALRVNNRDYDSKAIAGVAHKYQFPHLGPLKSGEFSGGISKGAAARKLAELGYSIIAISTREEWRPS